MINRIIALTVVVAVLFGCGRAEYEGILRLHVIANSNSAFDQAVKLRVKDKVSTVMADRGVKTYEEAVELVQKEEGLILAIANEVLREQGADYTVTMEVGVYDFPEKTYGNATFKAGRYKAVRLKLGEAKGENWWCVLFPPLCFLDSGKGEFDLGQVEDVEFKSLLLEIIK